MNDSGFLFVPEHIMEREDLSLQEKCVYGRIIGLTKSEGYCYATNEWIGKKLGLSGDTISSYISRLVQKNLLYLEIVKTKKGEGDPKQWGTRRKIYAFLPTPNGIGEFAVRGVGENAEYSNTQNSITTNNGDKPIVNKPEELEEVLPNSNLEEYKLKKEEIRKKKSSSSRFSGFRVKESRDSYGNYKEKKRGGVFHAEDIF